MFSQILPVQSTPKAIEGMLRTNSHCEGQLLCEKEEGRLPVALWAVEGPQPGAALWILFP